MTYIEEVKLAANDSLTRFRALGITNGAKDCSTKIDYINFDKKDLEDMRSVPNLYTAAASLWVFFGEAPEARKNARELLESFKKNQSESDDINVHGILMRSYFGESMDLKSLEEARAYVQRAEFNLQKVKDEKQKIRYKKALRTGKNAEAYLLAQIGIELDYALVSIRKIRDGPKLDSTDFDPASNPGYADTEAYVLMTQAAQHRGDIDYDKMEQARHQFEMALDMAKQSSSDENAATIAEIKAHLQQAEDLLRQ